MKEVEDLTIYKQYLELIYYVESITEKYPKSVKLSLVAQIRNNTYDGMKCILLAFKEYDYKLKLTNLNKLDTILKMQKVLIRVSYKKNIFQLKIIMLGVKKYAILEIY